MATSPVENLPLIDSRIPIPILSGGPWLQLFLPMLLRIPGPEGF